MRIIESWVGVAGLWCLCVQAYATPATPKPIEEQIKEVPLVVVGRVADQPVREGDAYTLHVEERLKGSSAPNRLLVRSMVVHPSPSMRGPAREKKGSRILALLDPRGEEPGQYGCASFWNLEQYPDVLRLARILITFEHSPAPRAWADGLRNASRFVVTVLLERIALSGSYASASRELRAAIEKQRRAACEALWEPTLLACRRNDPRVRGAALYALGALAGSAADEAALRTVHETALEATEADDSKVKIAGVWLLAAIRHEDCIPLALAWLEGELDADRTYTAILALRSLAAEEAHRPRLRTRRTFEALIQALDYGGIKVLSIETLQLLKEGSVTPFQPREADRRASQWQRWWDAHRGEFPD